MSTELYNNNLKNGWTAYNCEQLNEKQCEALNKKNAIQTSNLSARWRSELAL